MGIREDIRTVFEKDPAAMSTVEVICCYPQYFTKNLHSSFSHHSFTLDTPLLA
jgi:serine acetyltransferase